MTMTVKLPPEIEQRLRRRSAAEGRPAGALIRDALTQYLDADRSAASSPYALGAEVFGRHRGPIDLAERRKQHAADAWEDKHARRRR